MTWKKRTTPSVVVREANRTQTKKVLRMMVRKSADKMTAPPNLPQMQLASQVASRAKKVRIVDFLHVLVVGILPTIFSNGTG